MTDLRVVVIEDIQPDLPLGLLPGSSPRRLDKFGYFLCHSAGPFPCGTYLPSPYIFVRAAMCFFVLMWWASLLYLPWHVRQRH